MNFMLIDSFSILVRESPRPTVIDRILNPSICNDSVLEKNLATLDDGAFLVSCNPIPINAPAAAPPASPSGTNVKPKPPNAPNIAATPPSNDVEIVLANISSNAVLYGLSPFASLS
jgi:hypothetical protein